MDNAPVWMHAVLAVAGSIRKRYTTQHTLRNGVSVVFRPIECADNERFREFFKSLSPASIHFRFLEIIKELPNETVERFCKIDYNREMAIVAQPKGEERIVAVIRLVINDDRRHGEFALVTGDAWQGLGLGTELLSYILTIARDYGLDELHCFVSSDNLRMIGLARKMGFKVTSADDDTLRMALSLDGSDSVPIA